MATAVLTPSAHATGGSCGSWSTLTWNATSCAIDESGTDYVTFTSAIPIGSHITALSGIVNAVSTGGSSAPAHMFISSGSGLGSVTLRTETTLTASATDYAFSASGLDIVVDANTFVDGVLVLLRNKEAFYSSYHTISVSDLTVTYATASGANNLFFGSTF